MSIYRRVINGILTLRSSWRSGFTYYSGGYIGGSLEINRTIDRINFESLVSYSGDANHMFSDCLYIESISLANIDLTGVTDTSYMFHNCNSLRTLNLGNLNCANVTNMTGMFQKCSVLSTLDLYNFDTKNVTNMSYMFDYCRSLRTIDISSFKFDSVTDTSYMFSNCVVLETITVAPNTNLNVARVTQSTNMFDGDTSLEGGNGTPYNASKINKAYARVDKSGQAGYFTKSTRTLTTTKTGNGTITAGGTFDYGTEIEIIVTPDNATFYYLDKVVKTTDLATETVTDDDTFLPYSFKFTITRNTTINADFLLRQQHTITASSTYTIKGTGTYRYLDQPTLIAELGGGLIAFNGWYEGSSLVSTQNPYKFVMPDRDLALTIQTGENPFTSAKVRQFCLQNKDGAIYNLTSKASKIFLSNPSGIGMKKGYSQVRYGNSAEVSDEQYSFSQIDGELVFIGQTNEAIYQDYYEFARFITNAPIKLWYKIPTANSNTYHIPVEVVSLTKGETDKDGRLHCNITLKATGFWKETESSVSASTSTMEVLNDSDFSMGFEITCAKLNGTAFTNPRITFNNGSEYGVIAISSPNGQEYTSIKIITKDGKQDIILENGDSIITNPFGYIDFSYADGTKQFPFPKLEKGYTTINFIYDNVATEGKSYLIVYDKEFASV